MTDIRHGTPTNERPRRQLFKLKVENGRFVNIKCVNTNQSLLNVNPFSIKKFLDGQVDSYFKFV